MTATGLNHCTCPNARVARSLVSDRERAFTAILMKAFQLRVTVFVKVGVLDVLKFCDEPDESGVAFWRNTLGDKRFGYVVCRRKTLEPLLAVELDDPDHPATADAFTATVAHQAKFPLVHFLAKPKLTPEAVRQRLVTEYKRTRPGPLPEELG